jgi:hypothetical protein
MHQKAISLSLGALALFGVGIAIAQATSYSICVNSYTQGIVAPTGYGAAWDTVFGGQDVSVDCTGNLVTIGAGNVNQYIYKFGYVYATGAWQQLSLSGASSLQSSNWYTSSATASLGNVDLTQATYVVGYVCDRSNSAWKCGCADSACAAGMWQLQVVKGKLAQTTTTGGMSSGTTITVTPTQVQSGAAINAHIGDTLIFSYNNDAQHSGYNIASSNDPSVVSVVDAITANAVGAGTTQLNLRWSCTALCTPSNITVPITVNVN